MTYSDFSDETLLTMVSQQDAQALSELHDRHAQIAYNLIMQIVRDQGRAEEILQEAFWQVWKKADAFSGRGSVAGWLYRIARNKALDNLRRQKARPQADEFQKPADMALPDSAPTTSSVESVVSRQWHQQHIHQALNDMPAEQRHALELAYYMGMSQRQIAAHTDTSLGTVKTRLRLGLDKLERSLRAAGYVKEDVL